MQTVYLLKWYTGAVNRRTIAELRDRMVGAWPRPISIRIQKAVFSLFHSAAAYEVRSASRDYLSS